MPSNHLILCHPLLLLPSVFPNIRVFSIESVLCIRWPKYWIFSFSISPSNEYSRLISFRMDWLDLLAVQGTLKRLLQHYSSKASILRRSAFFTVQFSHPYMTTGKTTALTRQTFVGKVMSLLFNILPRLVIAFLPRSKCLFISWLQSPSATFPVKSLVINIVSLGCFGGWMKYSLFVPESRAAIIIISSSSRNTKLVLLVLVVVVAVVVTTKMKRSDKVKSSTSLVTHKCQGLVRVRCSVCPLLYQYCVKKRILFLIFLSSMVRWIFHSTHGLLGKGLIAYISICNYF